MTTEELQQFLLTEIPLARCMALEVEALSGSAIRLAAPLEPNRNDKGTGFGGSIASLMTLAGWSLLHQHLATGQPPAALMIHTSELRYQAPVTGRMTVETSIDSASLQGFLATLQTRGKARVELEIHCHSDDRLCARMQGRFVALLQREST